MKSILAHALQIDSPPERPRLDSGPSKREARDAARKSSVVVGHQRNSSGLSFAGFDPFEETRQGFEFNDGRPRFYPRLAQRLTGKIGNTTQSTVSLRWSYPTVMFCGSFRFRLGHSPAKFEGEALVR